MDIIRAIIEERQRQDVIWGGPAHDDGHTDADWGDILLEQTRNVMRLFRDGWESPDVPDLQHQIVEVAAVCYAWLESLNRRYAS